MSSIRDMRERSTRDARERSTRGMSKRDTLSANLKAIRDATRIETRPNRIQKHIPLNMLIIFIMQLLIVVRAPPSPHSSDFCEEGLFP